MMQESQEMILPLTTMPLKESSVTARLWRNSTCAVGIMMVTLLTLLYVERTSATSHSFDPRLWSVTTVRTEATATSDNDISSAQDANLDKTLQAKNHDSLRFCSQSMLGHGNTNETLLDVWYQCHGPLYDHFAADLHQLARQQSQAKHESASWGRRPTALPENARVLLFGNSHTRQIGQTLACQYADQIERIQHYDYNQPDPDMAVVVHFTNGAELIIVANSYVAHSPHWQRLLERQIQTELADLDAVVLGMFNDNAGNNKERHTRFAVLMEEMQASLPAADEVSIQDHAGPMVQQVAAVYKGPLLFVPMFATYRNHAAVQAAHQVQALQSNNDRQQQQQQQERSNVKYQETRRYITMLQQEGAAVGKWAQQDVVNDDAHGHRCTGNQGGHVDLVTWDVLEFLFAQIVV